MYTETLLHTQLMYFNYLFDVKHALSKLNPDRKSEGEAALAAHSAALLAVYRHVAAVVARNAYRFVSPSIFQFK